jgi:uncharacterized membrane protein
MMTNDTAADHGADAKQLDRLLFFSDAVFAIVLTLLVLELRPPTGESEAELEHGLSELTVHFIAFGISFALGAVFWLAHMRTMRSMTQFDWMTAAVNLIHLAAIALTPFASAFLGEHITSLTAFQVYAALVVFVSFSGCLLWLVASRGKGRFMGGVSARNRIAVALRTSAIGWCFLLSLILIPMGEVTYARFTWVLMAPLMTVSGFLGEKRKKQKPPAGKTA